MKIIIVDDSRSKIRKIVDGLLASNLVFRGDIDVAQSSYDGYDRLEAESYDLMILDLCLPDRPESEPELETSLRMLERLRSSNDFNRPKQIVGLSAYDEFVDEAKETFDENLWTLLRYSEEERGWLDGILACVRFLYHQERGESTAIGPVDLCLVTALYEPELTAVLALDWNWSDPIPLDLTTFVRKGSFKCEDRVFSVVAATTDRMGMVNTSILATKLIYSCEPKFLVMAGICAGINNKVNLGDPILATASWDYQSGKHSVQEGSSFFHIAPHQLHVQQGVETRMLEIARNPDILSKIREAWRGNVPDSVLRLRVGPMASGAAVLADSSLVDGVKAQQRKVLGIEMETYGLYCAAESAPARKPITFSVKSVCDFADEHKSDDYQKYSAYTSAEVIKYFFEKYTIQLDV
ncbi:hypothetical protein [uncultured Marinobacter sp.]|uniref:phosphorylase family protein n=1 Tax=uncultured Marinobacter sp. TaxID=187379 RepID=UPI002598E222|nr:hypothetical protein [uncultured Marinobacter sp.]